MSNVCTLFGKDIGSYEDCEYTADFGVLLFEFERSELGWDFLPWFNDGDDLLLDFSQGKAYSVSHGDDGGRVEQAVDWFALHEE